MIEYLEDPSQGGFLCKMKDGGYSEGHQEAKAINARPDNARGIAVGSSNTSENG